jgi:hypothetical protein
VLATEPPGPAAVDMLLLGSSTGPMPAAAVVLGLLLLVVVPSSRRTPAGHQHTMELRDALRTLNPKP